MSGKVSHASRSGGVVIEEESTTPPPSANNQAWKPQGLDGEVSVLGRAVFQRKQLPHAVVFAVVVRLRLYSACNVGRTDVFVSVRARFRKRFIDDRTRRSSLQN